MEMSLRSVASSYRILLMNERIKLGCRVARLLPSSNGAADTGTLLEMNKASAENIAYPLFHGVGSIRGALCSSSME